MSFICGRVTTIAGFNDHGFSSVRYFEQKYLYMICGSMPSRPNGVAYDGCDPSDLHCREINSEVWRGVSFEW